MLCCTDSPESEIDQNTHGNAFYSGSLTLKKVQCLKFLPDCFNIF